MCRPASFGWNPDTATDNYFMGNNSKDAKEIRQAAIDEFNAYVELLKSKGITVCVYEDTEDPPKPDACYCCNWDTFHEDGTAILYPMRSVTRRPERRKDVIEMLEKEHGFKIKALHDLSPAEEEGKFLEGAGSMVFDHVNKIVYASISPRTHKELVEKVGKILGYKVITWKSVDDQERDIYHANVIMSIGEKWAILCEESIPDEKERETVRKSLEETDHEVITVTLKQVYDYAANSYEAINNKGERFFVISERGYKSLTKEQIQTFEKYAQIISVPLPVIEYYGGGSARCMASDIRLPKA